jgi:hypothetical protein
VSCYVSCPQAARITIAVAFNDAQSSALTPDSASSEISSPQPLWDGAFLILVAIGYAVPICLISVHQARKCAGGCLSRGRPVAVAAIAIP